MPHKEMVQKIDRLRKERNAVILAHNYQLPEVQDIADHCGDSLELSRIAAKSDKRVIVFCGVYFMAETASILCPDKTILIPDPMAGCPMANMIDAEDVRQLKARHPKAIVVGYVNTPADVKAELDICCTSTNAVDIISKLKNEEIIFVPDKYLADYVSKKTNKRLIAWEGYCPTHVKILPEDIIKKVRQHPGAKVMVHPECRPEVVELADEVLSTGKMCAFAKKSSAKEFIVGTEAGMIHRLQKDNPDKKFYPASENAVCPNMKRTTLEKVLWSLEENKTVVSVSDDIRRRARRAIDKMVELA
ncbi:quinolinate synthase [Candidatus Velamenicoccus archaeovorus]|uniref:Quinolinate synthase n=1 Tax=Velamenicoccus archaeovorus TaxID=1930593 RepID=A0A410P2I4_VELA1|nr:quinolinate synthase NadA [Candidatus Velamenicoccus archaeovorus]QAT16302.1 quinolinate synthase [Candidatus Velamenicoccus archaeovorus]